MSLWNQYANKWCDGVEEERSIVARELREALKTAEEGDEPTVYMTIDAYGSRHEFEVVQVLENGDIVCRYIGATPGL